LVTNQAQEKVAVMMTDMLDNGVSDEGNKRQINPEGHYFQLNSYIFHGP
jgi:hypothetical protein